MPPKKRRGSDYVLAPGGAPPTTSSPPSGSSTTTPGSGGGGSGSGSSSGGGSGGGGNPYLAAQRKADRKAAKAHFEQAAILQQQIDAIRAALGPKGFRSALNTKLRNVTRQLKQQDSILMENYRSRVGDLKQAVKDNEASAADQGYAALSNAGRERLNALQEVAASGAGESDRLLAMQMSLRNYDANASEVERSRRDTLSSINAGLGDLNADTRTGRSNLYLEAGADREQLWTAFYNQKSEAYTQLGNVLGQQAAEYNAANQSVGSKRAKRRRKQASNASGAAFDMAAQFAGEAWKNPGIPKKIRRWDGRDDFETTDAGRTPITAITNAGSTTTAPEGATLREWSV